MKIGYACLTLGVEKTNFKTCNAKNANKENLLSIIEHNLKSLDNIIDYNIKNEIQLFRISSGIIPFGSSPVNSLPWWEIFEEDLGAIGDKIKKSGMRVSMHPGQYTVLNSPRKEVVVNAIKDLEYHNTFLDSLKASKQSKIILHIGGVYGDKSSAMARFMENYKKLNQKIKDRLVIENDDRSFTIEEVLAISHAIKIPVVYDNLHNRVLPSDSSKDDNYWIKKANSTWEKEDGRQKIHYSQQDKSKRPGAHSPTIKVGDFLDFLEGLEKNVDIMLEVKDKNLSAIKAINASQKKTIQSLENEWSKYKYSVLGASQANYNRIRGLLKDKDDYPVEDFYKLIEESLDLQEDIGSFINAAEHVWGYFKDKADEKEKKRFRKLIDRYKKGEIKSQTIKNFLNKLAIKYDSQYLRESYYFAL